MPTSRVPAALEDSRSTARSGEVGRRSPPPTGRRGPGPRSSERRRKELSGDGQHPPPPRPHFERREAAAGVDNRGHQLTLSSGPIQPPGWGLGRTHNACSPTPAGSHRTRSPGEGVCKGAENRLPSFPRAAGSPLPGAEGSLGPSPRGLLVQSPGYQEEGDRVRDPRPPPVLWVGVAWKGTVVILSPQKLEIGLKRCFRMGASRPPRCRLALTPAAP